MECTIFYLTNTKKKCQRVYSSILRWQIICEYTYISIFETSIRELVLSFLNNFFEHYCLEFVFLLMIFYLQLEYMQVVPSSCPTKAHLSIIFTNTEYISALHVDLHDTIHVRLPWRNTTNLIFVKQNHAAEISRVQTFCFRQHTRFVI